MKIGEKIKQKRIELGWSQRELAAKMEYSNHSTIGRIESGSVDIPQSKIVKFSEVLGVSIAYLMDWEEVQKKNETLSDIVVRLRSDAVFSEAVESLYKMDSDKLSSLLAFLK